MIPPSTPELELVFEAHIKVGPPQTLGQLPTGERRIIAITGGSFAGPKLKGKVLAGGADWQLIRADGVAEIDARYTLEKDGGGLIYVVNRGLRHGPPDVMAQLAAGKFVEPSRYYFRTVPTFETSAPGCEWLMRSLFIGVGERHPDFVLMRFWKLL